MAEAREGEHSFTWQYHDLIVTRGLYQLFSLSSHVLGCGAVECEILAGGNHSVDELVINTNARHLPRLCSSSEPSDACGGHSPNILIIISHDMVFQAFSDRNPNQRGLIIKLKE